MKIFNKQEQEELDKVINKMNFNLNVKYQSENVGNTNKNFLKFIVNKSEKNYENIKDFIKLLLLDNYLLENSFNGCYINYTDKIVYFNVKFILLDVKNKNGIIYWEFNHNQSMIAKLLKREYLIPNCKEEFGLSFKIPYNGG